MDVLAAMRVFVRVAESGSFVRAADALEMSRTMVSTRIAQLEGHLGARLVQRTTRRVALTDEGRAYLERASRILDEVAEAADAVTARRGVPRGRLRVAMPNAFARLVLVPALGRFRARFPALELEVVLSDRDPDLVEEGLDCAVRASEIRESDLVARRIGTSRLVTCAAPSYLAGRAPVRVPADLADHDCLGRLGGGGRQTVDWRFERDGERVALNPRGPLLFNTMEACVDAAVEGLGIARVFSSLAHAPIMAGRLAPLLVDWTPPGPPVSVVYARNRYLSAKVRAFADFAAEIFPTESWWRDIVAVAARGAKTARASTAGRRRRR